MNSFKPMHLRIVGVLLVTGLFLLIRQRGNVGTESNSATGGNSLPVGAAQTELGQATKRKPRGASVNEDVPRTFTSDELVAIYESRGVAAALAAAKSMKEPERASQVVFILTYLARIDPELVAGELKEAGLDTTHQGFIISAVMNAWKDGEKALAWATSNFTGDLLKEAVGRALRILVRTDPEAALAHLETMPSGGHRRQATSDLFSSWGGHDPKAALARISEMFPTVDRASAIHSVVTGWSCVHPAAAAAWVEAVQDEKLRAGLVGEVARNWNFKSPAEAPAWVESLPDGAGKEAGRAALREIQETIECGFSISKPAPDVSWKTKTVATMKDQDFWNWNSQDPEGARKHLESAPEGKDLTELATVVAAVISVKEGPEATFDWAQTLQGDAAKKALRLAVISWSGSDPAAAAKRLETIAPEQREPLATALAENWSRNDPAAAAAWVEAYDGAGQKDLVREVLQHWTDSQPREAYAWLGTLPMGESRDQGIGYLMRRESSNDPESIIPWIDLLSKPSLREKMRQELDGYIERARKDK